MAADKKEFRVSFRQLLYEIMKALGWPLPVYSHADLTLNQANLVLQKGPGPEAFFFRGEKKEFMYESEEHAAEQAVDYLVQKKRVIVDDFNLVRRNQYKAVCSFFQQKRNALKCAEWEPSNGQVMCRRRKQVVVPGYLPVMVAANLWDIWLQVVVAYNVIVDEMDFITQADGRYVCCFTVVWENQPSRERYFISDSKETVEAARQSLAKKVIAYFQTLYGFTVKDANFNRMLYSQIQCGFQRGRYRSVKAKQVCVPSDLEAIPLFIAEGGGTPEGARYGIRAGVTLPPAPKKRRVVCEDIVSGVGLNDKANLHTNVDAVLFDGMSGGSKPGNNP